MVDVDAHGAASALDVVDGDATLPDEDASGPVVPRLHRLDAEFEHLPRLAHLRGVFADDADDVEVAVDDHAVDVALIADGLDAHALDADDHAHEVRLDGKLHAEARVELRLDLGALGVEAILHRESAVQAHAVVEHRLDKERGAVHLLGVFAVKHDRGGAEDDVADADRGADHGVATLGGGEPVGELRGGRHLARCGEVMNGLGAGLRRGGAAAGARGAGLGRGGG